jgi:acyl transferase domain-containing protein
MNDTINISHSTTDVAIIGMACRFPGARGIDEFWRNLRDGVESSATFSDEEIARAGVDFHLFNDPSYVRSGTFIEGADLFDADFFGFTPREAQFLDPQQRMFLECCWEALESSGYDDEARRGAIGVYAGAGLGTYLLGFPESLRPHLLSTAPSFQHWVSNDKDFLATRVSYKLNLKGPSITVQTACSTSLVAVHLACQSLLAGECDMALAGGVSVFFPQKTGYLYQDGMIGSPDGCCRAFDAEAQGTFKGNGLGVVVLKTLAHAIEDGDRICAVIKGSAVNNDGGAKLGYTAPSTEGQVAVISEALAIAGIPAETISYVEAHGTGTPLGDPLEVQALTEVFRSGTAAKGFCAIGSVKTNLGHLDTAAGVASLIKTVLSLQHRQIPPSLHFHTPNPLIDFSNSPFYVNSTLREWKTIQGVRRAGVSSFGIGGTNVHVIVEEAPAPAVPSAKERVADDCFLLPLSARSPEALRSSVATYCGLFEQSDPALSLHDVCWTASVRRSHHDYRLAVVASSRKEVLEKLHAHLRDGRAPGVITGRRQDHSPGPLFVFSGQGPQWAGMGSSLLQKQPVFRDVIANCDRELRRFSGWALLEELSKDAPSSRLGETEIAQPAIFALQVALAALWQSWGVRPAAVAGHSVGEVAAAYIAGALSLEDAIRIVYHRGRLMQQATGRGKMLAVELPSKEVERILSEQEMQLEIAALNSPTSTVVAGEPLWVDRLAHFLELQNVIHRILPVNYAFHCSQMIPHATELGRILQGLVSRPVEIPMFSSVTGLPLESLRLGAAYWERNVKQPVRFADATEAAIREGHRVFIEIGPQPVLGPMISRCLSKHGVEGTVIRSMVKGHEDRQALLEGLGELYCKAGPIDWGGVYVVPGHTVQLPSYPWQRKRYWIEDQVSRPKHPLLGRRLDSPLPQVQFESRIGTDAPEFLADHRFLENALFPATAYVEMALAAAAQIFGDTACRLDRLEIEEMLELPENQTRLVQLVLNRLEERTTFQIFSRQDRQENQNWKRHATGVLQVAGSGPTASDDPLNAARVRCSEHVPTDTFYSRFSAYGFEYGPHFRRVVQLWRASLEAVGLAQISVAGRDTEVYRFHPVMLDACLQVLVAAIPGGLLEARSSNVYLPVGFDSLNFWHSPSTDLWIHATVRAPQSRSPEVIVGDIQIYDPDGATIAQVSGFRFRRVRIASRLNFQSLADAIYTLEWQPKESVEVEAGEGRWLILADRGGRGEALAKRLRTSGSECELINTESTITPEYYGRLLARPWRGIVHLWSLDAAIGKGETSDIVGAVSNRILGDTLLLVQALLQHGISYGVSNVGKLWLVTRGCQRVGRGSTFQSVCQSPLWGMGRVIALEHPDIWGGLIDLDPDSADISPLLHEITRRDGEDQIAYRDGVRHVLRWAPHRLADQTSEMPPWRSDATYLIVGGLGGVGFAAAEWIVKRGGRYLVLVGRAGPSDIQLQTLKHHRESGAYIEVIQADISRRSDVAEIVDRIRNVMPPLRGIIHTAGIVDDALLANQNAERFSRVLSSKIEGTWNLHLMTRELPLDFFVLFSSVAAVLGSRSQANYAAANAFLDGFAHLRKAAGLPALSINWGAWSGNGMAAAQGTRGEARLTAQGVRSIEPEQGFDLLERLIAGEHAQVCVFPVDWTTFTAQYPGRLSALPVPVLAAKKDSIARGRVGDDSLLQRLRESPARQARQVLRNHIRGEAAKVLGFPLHRVGFQLGFSEMGFDSLMALEFRDRLQMDLGTKLSSTLTFDYPTIDALSDYVGTLLKIEFGDQVKEPLSKEATSMAPSFEDLSGEDLLASFDKEMAMVQGLIEGSRNERNL